MSKMKFVVINSIAFVLIGSTLVSFAIEVVWMLVSRQGYIPVRRLVFNFIIGLVISTVIVFLHLLTMRLKKKPVIGYIISAFVITVLLFAVYVHTGFTTGYWILDAKWLVIFTVVESFSIFLIAYWYRQINLYSRKLEIKKASLRDKNTGKDIQ